MKFKRHHRKIICKSNRGSIFIEALGRFSGLAKMLRDQPGNQLEMRGGDGKMGRKMVVSKRQA